MIKKKQIIIGVIFIIALIVCIKPAHMYYEYKQEEKRFAETPYYTEFKLTRYEYRVMAGMYYVDENPHLRDEDEEERNENWPDFSYYTMEATEETEMVVTVLNHYLFDERQESDRAGWEKAEAYGFTPENRVTVEWVMSHPKEAVDIMTSMWNSGDFFQYYNQVKAVYDKITSISEDTGVSTEPIQEATENAEDE